jgi:hypothetical protein
MQAEFAAYLGGEAAHRFLDIERRIAGPHRVILVRDRRAKDRHDPVARRMGDGALVAVNRVDHAVDRRIEEPVRLLRVEIADERGRVRDVGEQGRRDLALAFGRGTRAADALGEVLRRADPGKAGLDHRERVAAGAAELLLRAHRRAAARAALAQAYSTGLTETRLLVVLEPAPALQRRRAAQRFHLRPFEPSSVR